MLVVYLSNKYIRAVKGKTAGKQIRVSNLYHTIDRSGCILNGTIVDADAFVSLMADFWKENNLPKKDVRLVLDSSSFTTKIVEVPVQKTDKMLEFIGREFSDVGRISDPVYGFFPIKSEQTQNKKMRQVFAMVSSREYLAEYVQLFKSIGVTITAVEPVMGTMLRLTAGLSEIATGINIVQFVDDITLVDALLVDGKQVYSSRNRLYSTPNTVEYAVEAARNVSDILQFAKAQNIGDAVSKVYVSGLSQEDYEIYSDGIMQVSETLETEHLSLEPEVRLPEDRSGIEVPGMVLAIGGLIDTGIRTNLLRQVFRNKEKEQEHKKLRAKYIPLVIVAAVMGAATGGLYAQKLYLNNRLEETIEFNNNPDVIEVCRRYDEAQAKVGILGGLRDSLTGLKMRIREYPKVDQATEQIVIDCANGLVTADIRSYDSSSGVLTFDITATDVALIHQFVNYLRAQNVFYNVDYTGYSQSGEGTWNVQVLCTMNGRDPDSGLTDTDAAKAQIQEELQQLLSNQAGTEAES